MVGNGADVVIFGDEPTALKEHLNAARGRPLVDVVPYRCQCGVRTTRVSKAHQRDVFDARIAGQESRRATHRTHFAKQPAKQVHIVNRVFDEGAAARLVHVCAPVAVVVAAHRQELVVTHVRSQQAPKVFGTHHVFQHTEHGRVVQHQANLMHNAGTHHGVIHGLRIGQVLGQWLLAEHVFASREGRSE